MLDESIRKYTARVSHYAANVILPGESESAQMYRKKLAFRLQVAFALAMQAELDKLQERQAA